MIDLEQVASDNPADDCAWLFCPRIARTLAIKDSLGSWSVVDSSVI